MRHDRLYRILFGCLLLALGAVGALALAGMAGPRKAEPARSVLAGEPDSGTRSPSADLAAGTDGGPADGARAAIAAIVDGSAVAGLQARFEQALPFRGFAVQAFGRLRWDLFREGFRGVLAGDDGWLFSTEEFSPDLGSLEGSLPGLLASVRDTLAARGVDLLVVPVPAKAVIESGRMGRKLPTPEMLERHGRFLVLLGSLGIPAVDIEPAFRSGPFRDGGASAFLRTDTHWTPGGAAAAARAVAEAVDRAGIGRRLTHGYYFTQSSDTRPHEGDLLSFLPAGGGWFREPPEPDLVSPPLSLDQSTAASASFDALFGNREIPVALVGTSYSASATWGFEAFLKEALQADVLNLAAEGRGPFEPMRDALAGGQLESAGTRLVVWEIPERYIPFAALEPARP